MGNLSGYTGVTLLWVVSVRQESAMPFAACDCCTHIFVVKDTRSAPLPCPRCRQPLHFIDRQVAVERFRHPVHDHSFWDLPCSDEDASELAESMQRGRFW